MCVRKKDQVLFRKTRVLSLESSLQPNLSHCRFFVECIFGIFFVLIFFSFCLFVCCCFWFFICVLFWICFLCNIHEYSNCPNSFPVKTASHHWLPWGLVHLLALMLLDIIIYICTAEIRNVNILFANG